MNNVLKFKQDLLITLKYLFDSLQIPHDKRELEDFLKFHPQYPSLASVVDALKLYNIDYVVGKTNYDRFLDEAPLPALTHFTGSSETIVVVTEVNADEISYYHPTNGKVTSSRKRFNEKWDGITVYLEKTEDDAKQSSFLGKKLTLPVILLVVVLFSFLHAWWEALPYVLMPIILTKILGFVLCFSLLWNRFGTPPKMIASICSFGNSFSCNLDSPKIFNQISLNELALSYFLGGYLLLMINFNSSSLIYVLLSVLSIGAILFSLFSLYLQGVKNTLWCPFCIIIAMLLWVEAGYLWWNSDMEWTQLIDYGYLKLGLLPFFLAIIISISLVKFWQQNSNLIQEVKQFDQVLYFPKVYHSLLGSKNELSIDLNENLFSLGNESAEITLSAVLSPTCKPCKALLMQILALWTKYPESIRIKLNFQCQYDENCERLRNSLKIILNDNGEEKFVEAIKDWYYLLNFDKWFTKYTLKYSRETDIQIDDTFGDNQLSYVPVLFINNQRVPPVYTQRSVERLLFYFHNFNE